MKIICTICSKHKDEIENLLQAQLRYTSAHIKATKKIAEELGLPFFVLSGKYGLIPGDEKIQNYDYYLEKSAIDSLSHTVKKQLQKYNITEINFYTKGEASWIPYEVTLQKGTELAGVILRRHLL